MSISQYDFKYDTLAVSKKQFDAHINLYRAYILKYNEIEKLESTAQDNGNSIYSQLRALKKAETFTLSSVILHELYFSNMTAERSSPKIKTLALIEKFFGGLDSFINDLKNTSLSARGWCLSVFELRTGMLKNILLDSHDDGNIPECIILIAADMYEHAYFYDYLDKKKDYIQKFIQTINWAEVEKRVVEAGL